MELQLLKIKSMENIGIVKKSIEKSIFLITLTLSKFFCQKNAISWKNTCLILCQASDNPAMISKLVEQESRKDMYLKDIFGTKTKS